MLRPEDIEHQLELLQIYRRTLAHWMQQAAQHGGESLAPAQTANGIYEAREHIRRIKSVLRENGVPVEDFTDENTKSLSVFEKHMLPVAMKQSAPLPLDSVPDPAPLPPNSRMSLGHNPLFVGRLEELNSLAAVLNVNNAAAIGQVAAAIGLGGIGKTQLAAEFVHRYGQFFKGGIFWLNFDDADAIPIEVASCGGTGYMDLRPDFNRLPLDQQVQLVRAAWQQPIPRLLVFDNCEDVNLFIKWRPLNSGARVLITSRRAHWDSALGILLTRLDVLPRKESIALLRKHRPDLPPGSVELVAIAAELGDLPLALHLAGSFLARYRYAVTPAAYLKQLSSVDLLKHPSLNSQKQDILPTRHEKQVARTFAMSYTRLDISDPTDSLAIKLLA